jgi:hypothetical protein
MTFSEYGHYGENNPPVGQGEKPRQIEAEDFTVTIRRFGPTRTNPFVRWTASVRLDGHASCGFSGETPQQALSGLAVYWAQNYPIKQAKEQNNE